MDIIHCVHNFSLPRQRSVCGLFLFLLGWFVTNQFKIQQNRNEATEGSHPRELGFVLELQHDSAGLGASAVLFVGE
jgi:hypothetical protein